VENWDGSLTASSEVRQLGWASFLQANFFESVRETIKKKEKTSSFLSQTYKKLIVTSVTLKYKY